MKHLKRFTALLLTFVIALGIPISANAIQDWYDVSDPLQYTSDLRIGNYTYRAGTSSTVMRLDETNRIAYCIQPDVQIGGNESDWFYETVSSTPAWNALSLNQQTAINLLLLYGYPNQNLPGNKPEQYFATREIIWEIVMGYRDSTHPYTRRDARCYNAFSGHAGFVQAYKELEKRLTSHFIRPSFTMGVPSQAPTIILDYNPSTKKYEKTVTDTNNVLSSFNFSISGVTLSRNGNTLSISTANKITAGTAASSTKPLPSPASTGILIWQSVNNPSGNQNMITGGGAGDPVPAYFKLAIGEGTVQIRKTDATHGGFFAGAVYGIYDSSGTKVDELTTSATDYVKSKPLPLGHYYLQELKAPSGAILDTTKHEFDLTTNGATLSLSVSDQSQTANILITKQGEVLTGATQSDSEFGPLYTPTYGLSALSGAVYDIYANENIVSAGGKQLYTKDQLVYTVNSGAKSPNLPLGQYRAVEKTAPSGFALDTTPHIIDLTYKGQTVTVYTEPVTVTNQRQKVTVALTKFIEENPIFPNPDAYKYIRFGIFTAQDFKDSSGNVVIPQNSLVDIISLDESLKGVSSADLPIGSYYLKELQTAPGWVLNETIYPFTFEAQPQEVQEITIDPSNGEPIVNNTRKGFIEIIKKSVLPETHKGLFIPSGLPVGGAVYGIFTPDGTQVDELITNEEGYAKSSLIPHGNYYVAELVPPFGMELDPAKYPVSIQEDGEIISVESIDIAKLGTVTGFYQDTGGGDGLDVAPIVKEPQPLAPTISTGDHTSGFIIFLTAAAGGSLLLLLLFRKKKKARILPVVILAFSLVFLAGCGGSSESSVPDSGTSSAPVSQSDISQADSIITLEQEFTTTSKPFHANFEEITEQGEITYHLKSIEYTVLSEKKLEQPATVTQQVEYSELLSQNAEAPQTITIEADGKRIEGTLTGIEYTPITITGRETEASAFTDYGLDVNLPTPPNTKEIQYTDPQTGKTVSAVLSFDHLEVLDDFSWRSDVTIPLTFSYYDSFGYVLEDVFIPYNEEIPAIDGFESVLLDSLSLSREQYRITGFQWTGEPYEQDGVFHRDATASGQRYAASYRAVYSGTVSLPDVPGYDAVATYTGTIQKPTGKTEYTVKAVATYEKEPTSEPEAQSQPNTGLTPIQIVLLSVAAFLLVVLVVGLLSILAKRRKKKEKEI